VNSSLNNFPCVADLLTMTSKDLPFTSEPKQAVMM